MKLIFSRICLLGFLALIACGGDSKKPPVTEGDDDTGEVTDPNGGLTAPAPWTNVAFTTQDVEVKSGSQSAGNYGKLLRDEAGTLYYSYLRAGPTRNECAIAVFGSDTPLPSVAYDLVVAVKPAAATAFSLEKVPLENAAPSEPTREVQGYISNPLGIDAVIDNSNRLVISAPAGGNGQFVCASSDLVVTTRTGPNAYNVTAPVVDSTSCCAIGTEDQFCPDDGACTQGSDVGGWSAIAVRSNGSLAVAYTDTHFTTDQDGQDRQGLEIWKSGGGVAGIRPWSGYGRYAALREINGNLVAAYSSYDGATAWVVTEQPDGSWTGQDQAFGATVGERLQLEVAPNGTVGLAYYATHDNSGRRVDDLYLCESTDNGVTFPAQLCSRPESATLIAGQNPSLAYDSQSRPVLSYYYCGSNGCTSDGLRVAWRDNTGKWWKYNVRNIANNRSGFYSSVVIDPTTDEPIIAFQDLTRGAAMVAYGNF